MANSESRLLHRQLDLLLRTGMVLMENAADTSRVMRTMKRVATWMKLPIEDMHVHIVNDMLMVNVSNADHSYTKFQRVEHNRINYDILREVSRLSCEASEKNYSLDDYERELKTITARKRKYSPWLTALGGGLACGGFCIQFGCDWVAFFYAAIAAILGLRLRLWLNTRNNNEYVTIGIVAFVSTILAWLLGLFSQNCSITFFHSETPWHPMLACALFIIPGVPLINFVSDMLSGYVQMGCTRAVKTLMILTAMAFGIAFAIQVCGIDDFVRDLPLTPHHRYRMYIIAAAISAVGFSMIFNTPRHLLWTVAIGGIIAVCTRNIVSLGPSSGNVGLDLGPIIGSFCGSVFISVVWCLAVRRLHTPHQCLSIPSVIPLIPGVLMYRALFGFINMHGIVGEVTFAMTNAIHASLIILCISIGVAIPNIFFRRLIS